jgi:hypothetical protein
MPVRVAGFADTRGICPDVIPSCSLLGKLQSGTLIKDSPSAAQQDRVLDKHRGLLNTTEMRARGLLKGIGKLRLLAWDVLSLGRRAYLTLVYVAAQKAA